MGVEFAASLGLGSLANYVRGFKNLTALVLQHTRDMKPPVPKIKEVKNKPKKEDKKKKVKELPVKKSNLIDANSTGSTGKLTEKTKSKVKEQPANSTGSTGELTV